MPRVLSISHSYVVALNRRLVQEMGRLAGESWEFVAIAPRFFHADLRSLAAEPSSPDDGFKLETVPVAMSRSNHAFLYGLRLRRVLRRGFDLVHAWEEPYVLAGAQIAAWTPRNTPLVFASFQNLPKRYPPPFAQLERFAVGRSMGLIAWGTTVAEALQSREPYRGRSIRTITPGVDLERFAPNEARGRETRRQLGWTSEGGPVVGFLGRFVPEKGLSLLCRTLERLQGPWRALLVGTGPLETFLRQWARRRPERVRVVTGVRHDDVPRFLNAMDLLCAPSQTLPNWREQFGRMLIEAFASGVPVIGSSSGEIPYTVGDAGLVVSENDEEAWRTAIERVLADRNERERLAALGLARARLRYAWPVVARNHLSFFAEILEKTAPSSHGARSASR
jgi:glycosyltransferase involved in cell wall biosynthesis